LLLTIVFVVSGYEEDCVPMSGTPSKERLEEWILGGTDITGENQNGGYGSNKGIERGSLRKLIYM
jgi:hypothetical protein